MLERFKNPPLVELIAELRWGNGGGHLMSGTPSTGQFLMLPAGQNEEFFMRFGSKVGALGYDRIERVVPQGFPITPFQVIYRFRKKEPEEGTTLYQVGGGVFTAHITPPYHSWEQFRPVVERGLECLLETRLAAEGHMPFSQINLRYINSFGNRFTGGRSAASFIQDVLGFRVNLPKSLRSEMLVDGEAKPLLQLAVPLKSGQLMNLMLADGFVAGEQTTIMDTSVVQEGSIPAFKNDVMNAFEAAHGAIHRIFVGVTRDLVDVMQPVSGEDE